MFTQGHRITGKEELVQSSVAKVHEASQMFVMVDYVKFDHVKVDYVKEMTSEKSSEYGKYGL